MCIMMQYKSHHVAGYKIRSPPQYKADGTLIEDKDQGLQGETTLPPWIVPLCAPLVGPSGADFIQGLLRAYAYVKTHGSTGENFIVVPIDSPGGNTADLKAILDLMNCMKSWANTDGRHIKFVTFGIGQQASCAFVLLQCGDIVAASTNSQGMCHVPSITMSPADKYNSTNEMMSGKVTLDLRELKELLYMEAERCMFKRLGRPGESIVEWRLRWWQTHNANGDLIGFIACYAAAGCKNVPTYNGNYDVFVYLTKDAANNETDLWISAKWMHLLELVDIAGIDIGVTEEVTLQLLKCPGFEERLGPERLDVCFR